jgi:hypothetical protein
VLDLVGAAVAYLLHVCVDGAAFQSGEGELGGDAHEGAYGQRNHPEQAK